MGMKFDLQLFGGGGGGGSEPDPVKQNAPGSQAAATIEQATAGQKEALRNKFSKRFGRNSTNATNGGAGVTMDSIKKALLGE